MGVGWGDSRVVIRISAHTCDSAVAGDTPTDSDLDLGVHRHTPTGHVCGMQWYCWLTVKH